MKRILTLTFGLLSAVALAQKNGAITETMLQQIKQQNPPTATNRALRNALAANGINDLTQRADRPAVDAHFTYEVPTKGITDQKSSGRCWLFTGLNVMRARIIKDYNLGEFTLSQSFVSFYDQLEKSNLFLQSIIDYAKEPIDSRQNTWLFQHPLSDGGTFSGVQDLVMKYGIVPSEVFPESYNANNTSKMADIISLKLRQYGLELRTMVNKGKSDAEVQQRKTTMLGEVYHILQICLGTPVEKFTWTLRTADGKAVNTREYTPKQFYQEYVGKDLKNDYVMLMNDPTRPYYKLYAVDLDRHTYDGRNWTYINLPMNDIKKMAVKSLADTTMMYMSCDVGKFLDRKYGILDPDNFDYASLFNTTFPMNKAERIETYASASSHAMTLMAVDLDAKGKTTKWMVENSWGATSGYKGHLIMTDKWLDEYLFRLVVDKKYVDAKTLNILNSKPTLLPAWDPLFQEER